MTFNKSLRNERVLAPPEILSGDISFINQLPLPDPVKQAVQQVNAVNHEYIVELRKNTTPYQPLLLILDVAKTTDEVVETFLECFEEQLLLKVILLSLQGTASTQKPLQSTLKPFSEPCKPIVSLFLPRDRERLLWEIENFMTQASVFSENCSKLLRVSSLSNREVKVSNYVAIGYPNKKIASILGLSEKTIEKCRKEIYRKLSN